MQHRSPTRIGHFRRAVSLERFDGPVDAERVAGVGSIQLQGGRCLRVEEEVKVFASWVVSISACKHGTAK